MESILGIFANSAQCVLKCIQKKHVNKEESAMAKVRALHNPVGKELLRWIAVQE